MKRVPSASCSHENARHEGADAADEVDDAAAGEVEVPELGEPAAAPGPVAHGRVHDACNEKHVLVAVLMVFWDCLCMIGLFYS